MKFSSLSISKMGDKLVKAMEAKERFDSKTEKPKEDLYTQKVKPRVDFQ